MRAFLLKAGVVGSLGLGVAVSPGVAGAGTHTAGDRGGASSSEADGSALTPLACTGLLAHARPTANNGAGSTQCESTSPQPLSHADQTGHGANTTSSDNPYAATGFGQVQGGHLAGTEGKADNKFPPGQAPDGTDGNRGYECDQNPGIGNGDPAHTTCRRPTESVTPPGGNETPPTGNETPPSGNETPPAGHETPPSGNETPPAGNETPPSGNETPPSGNETPPSGEVSPAHEDVRSAVMSPPIPMPQVSPSAALTPPPAPLAASVAPPPAPSAAAATPPPATELAFTGPPKLLLAVVGFALIGIGSVFMWLGRRRSVVLASASAASFDRRGWERGFGFRQPLSLALRPAATRTRARGRRRGR